MKNAKSTMTNVFNAIENERGYQDNKWGHVHDKGLSVGDWILVMESELAEAKKAFVKTGEIKGSLQEILQVVSVGVACLEMHGVEERE